MPHDDKLPVAPAAMIVHGEQGLGDTLFFLRFIPRLRELGRRLAFWGDARLHPLLAPHWPLRAFPQARIDPR